MAIKGIGGALHVGTPPARVAELKGWALDISADEIDVTTLDGEGWKEFLSGLREWSASSDGNLVMADGPGQGALYAAYTTGAPVAVEFRLAGGAKFSGSVIVTGFSVDNPLDDAVSVSLELRGTGALAYTA